MKVKVMQKERPGDELSPKCAMENWEKNEDQKQKEITKYWSETRADRGVCRTRCIASKSEGEAIKMT